MHTQAIIIIRLITHVEVIHVVKNRELYIQITLMCNLKIIKPALPSLFYWSSAGTAYGTKRHALLTHLLPVKWCYSQLLATSLTPPL
jgi:hypothetical protein